MDTTTDSVMELNMTVPNTPESSSSTKRFKADPEGSEEAVKPAAEIKKESPTARRTATREQVKSSLLLRSSKPSIKTEPKTAQQLTTELPKRSGQNETPATLLVIPAAISDETVIRRKLMFEAGNPPASSYRGIKLLANSVGALVNSVSSLRPEEEIQSITQRIQLNLQHEELTLTRLTVACQSINRIAEYNARLPSKLKAEADNVQEQIDQFAQTLEEANKAELLFTGYVESANRIRKLDAYDDLTFQRDKLREETRKLKEEKAELDRQQSEKQPFLVIANWALQNVRYGTAADVPVAPSLPSSSTVNAHTKANSRHRKSPKKTQKEPRSN